MSSPRIAIVGARRGRQGLGPYVARSFQEAGAEVVAFAATSPATVDEASRQLAAQGVTARGYADGEAMLAAEDLDALAILTPSRHHRSWLQRALDADLPVLCEKPLLWGEADDVAAGRRLVEGFAARDLALVENCQWPFTIPAFFTLHPGLEGQPPTRFAMRLGPASTGIEMLGDALPHPLSLLQHLSGSAEIEVHEAHFSNRDPGANQLDLAFAATTETGSMDVVVELSQSPQQPREASWCLNGHWAHRLVRPRDYALFFASGARVVDVPDPLPALVRHFVDRLPDGNDGAETRRILGRIKALDSLVRAYRDHP